MDESLRVLHACRMLNRKGLNDDRLQARFYAMFKYVFNKTLTILRRYSYSQELFFVYSIQIVTYLYQFKRIINIEKELTTKLIVSRHHFSRRIDNCFMKLTKFLQSDKLIRENNDKHYMELMEEATKILQKFFQQDIRNNSQREQLNMRIFEIVQALISRALALADVMNVVDKKKLLSASLIVLEVFFNFQDEVSSESNENFNVSLLDDTLSELALHFERSFIRLVYQTFLGFDKYFLVKFPKDGEIIVKRDFIEKYDLNSKRMIQVGHAAIAFTEDPTVKIVIKNSLACLQSTESFFLLTFLEKSMMESQILIQHVQEQFQHFKSSVESVISCDKFCKGYIDILEDYLNEPKLHPATMNDILFQGNILLDYLENKPSCRETLEDILEQLRESRELGQHNKLPSLMRRLVEISFIVKIKDKLEICKEKKINANLRALLDVLYQFRAALSQDTVEHELDLRVDTSEAVSEEYFANYNILPFRNEIYHGRKWNEQEIMTELSVIVNTEGRFKPIHVRDTEQIFRTLIAQRFNVFRRTKMKIHIASQETIRKLALKIVYEQSPSIESNLLKQSTKLRIKILCVTFKEEVNKDICAILNLVTIP